MALNESDRARHAELPAKVFIGPFWRAAVQRRHYFLS